MPLLFTVCDGVKTGSSEVNCTSDFLTYEKVTALVKDSFR